MAEDSKLAMSYLCQTGVSATLFIFSLQKTFLSINFFTNLNITTFSIVPKGLVACNNLILRLSLHFH